MMRHHFLPDAVAVIGTMDLVFGSVPLSSTKPVKQLLIVELQRGGSVRVKKLQWISVPSNVFFATCLWIKLSVMSLAMSNYFPVGHPENPDLDV